MKSTKPSKNTVLKTKEKRPVKEFSYVTSVETARLFLRDAGVSHTKYSFYTTVQRVIEMLETGYLWLTRLNSGLFDDGIEHNRYGKKSVSSSLFVKCFQFGTQESAAMWGLYCPPTYQAIRVTIPGESMDKLARSSFVEIRGDRIRAIRFVERRSWIQDIVYASGATWGNLGEQSGVLWHDGERTEQIPRLKTQIHSARGTGIVKDVEWMFENETRLFVKMKSPRRIDHIAVKLPREVVESMSFVLSPWATEPERTFVHEQIVKVFEKKKWGNLGDGAFRISALQDGLKLWAKRRGLS